jgi:hypothetical protein
LKRNDPAGPHVWRNGAQRLSGIGKKLEDVPSDHAVKRRMRRVICDVGLNELDISKAGLPRAGARASDRARVPLDPDYFA